jgi:chorismate mutase-like protein
MELEEIREKIDKLDSELLSLLAKRQSLVSDVADYKIKNNLPIYHPQREQEIIEAKKKLGKEYGLRAKYVEKIFKTMIEESKYLQKEIIEK